MKQLLILAALFLSACAHETTTMDRELALKLADKSPVIVQSAPTAVNIYNGGGGFHTAQTAPVDDREQCMNSPVYTMTGQFSHYVKQCFGAH